MEYPFNALMSVELPDLPDVVFDAIDTVDPSLSTLLRSRCGRTRVLDAEDREAMGVIRQVAAKLEAERGIGWAVVQMKQGRKVCRPGWNGKGMYLYLHTFEGYYDADDYEPCVVMHTAQGKEQPGWLTAQPDLLATDWELYED